MMSRAAQTHLAGHMRPAGRVFETPDLEHSFKNSIVQVAFVILGRYFPNNIAKIICMVPNVLF